MAAVPEELYKWGGAVAQMQHAAGNARWHYTEQKRWSRHWAHLSLIIQCCIVQRCLPIKVLCIHCRAPLKEQLNDLYTTMQNFSQHASAWYGGFHLISICAEPNSSLVNMQPCTKMNRCPSACSCCMSHAGGDVLSHRCILDAVKDETPLGSHGLLPSAMQCSSRHLLSRCQHHYPAGMPPLRCHPR